jgi:hypothetical protein
MAGELQTRYICLAYEIFPREKGIIRQVPGTLEQVEGFIGIIFGFL